MGAARDANGIYSIECNARKYLPDVTFNIAGQNFSIGPENYILDSKGSCISAFFGNDHFPPFAVLGTAFLRKWYGVFDFNTITISFSKTKAMVQCCYAPFQRQFRSIKPCTD